MLWLFKYNTDMILYIIENYIKEKSSIHQLNYLTVPIASNHGLELIFASNGRCGSLGLISCHCLTFPSTLQNPPHVPIILNQASTQPIRSGFNLNRTHPVPVCPSLRDEVSRSLCLLNAPQTSALHTQLCKTA